jgi:predicted transcriptional regulator
MAAPASRSTDRHKRHPLTVRLSEALWDRLERFASHVGKAERVIVREAVTEYLDRHDPETPDDPKENDR